MKMQLVPFEKKIWLSSPTMHGQELAYIKEAYDSNWVSTVGQNIDIIEKKIARIVGCQYAVALSSGTAALHLAIRLAGVRLGDRVFCSDLTFIATVNPIIYEGGIPIFIDSEYDTWNMDPNALEKAFQLYPNVKVVVVTHLYGTPSKITEIKKICNQHGAILIEDAAESLGASYHGKETGSFGKYNCISFNGNKIITGSSGGMLLIHDAKSANKVKMWATQSRKKAPWYQHEEIGFNYRMSNIIAGIIRGQLPFLKDHIEKKRSIYERYKEGLKNLPVQMNPSEFGNSKSNYWLSCMIINPDAMCKQVRKNHSAYYMHEHGKSCPTEILEKLAEYNVEGRPIWKPMHMQPVFRKNEFVTLNVNDCGISKKNVGTDIFNRGLCLPSDVKMTVEEQDKIIEIIKSCFE